MINRTYAWLSAIAMLLSWPHMARAAVSCSVDASGVAFGVVDPLNGAPHDGVGNITVGCTWDGLGSADIAYVVNLSSGTGGTGILSRRLTAGAQGLSYNLYSSSDRSAVWGDGTTGAQSLSSGPWTLTSPNVQETRAHTMYGRIPGGQQTTPVGNYGDTVSVTISF